MENIKENLQRCTIAKMKNTPHGINRHYTSRRSGNLKKDIATGSNLKWNRERKSLKKR